jgi:hypothetical protein
MLCWRGYSHLIDFVLTLNLSLWATVTLFQKARLHIVSLMSIMTGSNSNYKLRHHHLQNRSQKQ